MKEILANTISKVEYRIYIDGVLTDATGDVRVTVLRDGVKVVDNQLATAPSGTDGTYQYLLPTSVIIDAEQVPVTITEGILEAIWTFTVSSNTLSVKEYYSVVTPYCSWEYFAPTEVGDTTPTYKEYLECERVARFIINSYCGQEFGQEITTYAIEGHGTNSLALPRRLQTLDTVTWSGNPVARSGQIIGYEYPYAWEVIGNWTIRQQPYPRRVDPVYNSTPRFVRNRTYNVSGLWGYAAVPTPVEEAAKILTADFMCKEAKYRDKYLDNIKMGDWRIQFAAGAFNGTGNAKADDLLLDYRLMPGVGLI
jgi:hypothetical protein